jgi:hypothetical protein
MVVQDQLLVFGGVQSSGAVLSDAWSFSFTSGTWRQLNTADANAIGPRYLHVALTGAQANSVCLYGGASVANTGLLVASTASNAIYCFNLVSDSWSSPLTTTGVVPTLVAPIVLQSTAAGFTVMGGVSAGILSKSLLSYSFSPAAWVSTLAAPIAYAASDGNGFYFGGIVSTTASLPFNTYVVSVSPPGVWVEHQLACEPGFSGATCTAPLCQNKCNGLGVCVFPDLCECTNGFTGALCTQQTSSTCNVNWLDLNQAVLWPRAQNKALTCMAVLEQQILQIQQLLPKYPGQCGETASKYPFDLKAISKVSQPRSIDPGACCLRD